MSAVMLTSSFRASGGIPSGPAAFPFFNILSVFITSLLVGGLMSTFSMESAGGTFGLMIGGGLLRSS